jgi:hypothetical protein
MADKFFKAHDRARAPRIFLRPGCTLDAAYLGRARTLVALVAPPSAEFYLRVVCTTCFPSGAQVKAMVAFLASEPHATVELVVCADFFSRRRLRLKALLARVSHLVVLNPRLAAEPYMDMLQSISPSTLRALSLHGLADVDRRNWELGDFRRLSDNRVLRNLLARFQLVELRLLGCFEAHLTDRNHGGSIQVSTFTHSIALVLLGQRTLRLLDLSGNVGFVSLQILAEATLKAAPSSQLESLRLDERVYDDILTDHKVYASMFIAAFAWQGLPRLRAVYLGVCPGHRTLNFLPFLRTPPCDHVVPQFVALRLLLRCP